MNYLAIITGDWNDGDYVRSVITGNEDLVKRLIKAYKLTETFITTYHAENPSEWGVIEQLMN